MKGLSIIVAMTQERVIGSKGKLPWNISEDLQLFKKITRENTVLMGRKTFETLRVRPLPQRNNIVLSRTDFKFPGVEVCDSIDSAVKKAQSYGKEVFVAGGQQLYLATLPFANKLYISHIKGKHEGDVYFPEINWDHWKEVDYKEFDMFTFKKYERIIE